MSVYEHLSNVVNFAQEHFCEDQECEDCNHFDRGTCPVYLAKEFLIEEGYEDE